MYDQPAEEIAQRGEDFLPKKNLVSGAAHDLYRHTQTEAFIAAFDFFARVSPIDREVRRSQDDRAVSATAT